jgi:hypothetical protein
MSRFVDRGPSWFVTWHIRGVLVSCLEFGRSPLLPALSSLLDRRSSRVAETQLLRAAAHPTTGLGCCLLRREF